MANPQKPLPATARTAMNDSLCDFGTRWELDGDYLRCRKCKRPHIASRGLEAFTHAAGCKNIGGESHPWKALLGLLGPLVEAICLEAPKRKKRAPKSKGNGTKFCTCPAPCIVHNA